MQPCASAGFEGCVGGASTNQLAQGLDLEGSSSALSHAPPVPLFVLPRRRGVLAAEGAPSVR